MGTRGSFTGGKATGATWRGAQLKKSTRKTYLLTYLLTYLHNLVKDTVAVTMISSGRERRFY